MSVENFHRGITQDDHADGGDNHPEEGEMAAAPERELEDDVTEERRTCGGPNMETAQQVEREGEQFEERGEGEERLDIVGDSTGSESDTPVIE